jgi:hypothetical protein
MLTDNYKNMDVDFLNEELFYYLLQSDPAWPSRNMESPVQVCLAALFSFR